MRRFRTLLRPIVLSLGNRLRHARNRRGKMEGKHGYVLGMRMGFEWLDVTVAANSSYSYI